MDKEKYALNSIIPYLEDHVFDNYIGLYNAQRASRPMSATDEIELLRYVLNTEFNKTQNPEIPFIIEMLDGYLS